MNMRWLKTSIERVIERLIESYEELQDYIEEKWTKVQKDNKFINIEDYAESRSVYLPL